MKRQVKYRVLTIQSKLAVDIRLTADTNNAIQQNRTFAFGETTTELNGDFYTSVNLFPFININIIRRGDLDENGVWRKAPFSRDDNIGLTRYQLSIFIAELQRIHEAIRIPEMFSYFNKRLQVNEELANKYRRVFTIGSTTFEMLPLVITQPDDTRVEGIKLKFNNEQSSVLLTLNDLDSLSFTLTNLDIDTIVWLMYLTYLRTGETNVNQPQVSTIRKGPVVDILPKAADIEDLL